MKSQLTVAYDDEAQYSKACELAERLHLPLSNESGQQLVVTADKLVLKINSFSPLYADFTLKSWQKRRDSGKQQGLVRACKPKSGMTILDVTAGWGRDAAVLSSFGAKVVMLERHPVIAALLEDALIHRDERSKEVLKLSLIPMNAIDYLQHLKEEDYPELIYIDPMHPVRQKTALVKKELQALQTLICPDEDALSLINLAVKRATQKVVVKWPQQLPPLVQPSQCVDGKTVRFDIYVVS